jgi:hypothetical protein
MAPPAPAMVPRCAVQNVKVECEWGWEVGRDMMERKFDIDDGKTEQWLCE